MTHRHWIQKKDNWRFTPFHLHRRRLVDSQVGTQDISPLRWAIESGSLSAAKAIIEDLLTIRADRERYYYGVDALFLRHPDIVPIICSEAPLILGTFLEGLVWRSRLTKDGLRRVNYYVKNLVIDAHGHFSGALQALVRLGDPKIISHPTIDLVSNRLWHGVVSRQFMLSKLWFILSLVILMVSQTLLPEQPGWIAIHFDYLWFLVAFFHVFLDQMGLLWFKLMLIVIVIWWYDNVYPLVNKHRPWKSPIFNGN